jgi:hypothetical protein
MNKREPRLALQRISFQEYQKNVYQIVTVNIQQTQLSVKKLNLLSVFPTLVYITFNETVITVLLILKNERKILSWL